MRVYVFSALLVIVALTTGVGVHSAKAQGEQAPALAGVQASSEALIRKSVIYKDSPVSSPIDRDLLNQALAEECNPISADVLQLSSDDYKVFISSMTDKYQKDPSSRSMIDTLLMAVSVAASAYQEQHKFEGFLSDLAGWGRESAWEAAKAAHLKTLSEISKLEQGIASTIDTSDHKGSIGSAEAEKLGKELSELKSQAEGILGVDLDSAGRAREIMDSCELDQKHLSNLY